MGFLGRAAILGMFIGLQGMGCAHLTSGAGDSDVSIRVSASRGGRAIEELDWNGDGKVTGHDVKLIEATAASTVSRLEEAPFDGFIMPRHKETTLKLTKNGEGYLVQSSGIHHQECPRNLRPHAYRLEHKRSHGLRSRGGSSYPVQTFRHACDKAKTQGLPAQGLLQHPRATKYVQPA